jgi:hypothetical protein
MNTFGPNYRSALDARTALCLHIEDHWPSASESDRSPERTTVVQRLLLFGFICLVFCLSASAEILTNGLPMATTSTAMQKAGYAKTGLDMAPRPGSGEDLQFWAVAQVF